MKKFIVALLLLNLLFGAFYGVKFLMTKAQAKKQGSQIAVATHGSFGRQSAITGVATKQDGERLDSILNKSVKNRISDDELSFTCQLMKKTFSKDDETTLLLRLHILSYGVI